MTDDIEGDLYDFALDNSASLRDFLCISGLQEILDLENLTEVAVNEPFIVWFDRGNGWESKNIPHLDFNLCMGIANALVVYSGITEQLGLNNPLASVVLPDGERGQIAVPPATKSGVVSMTIRKPSTKRYTLLDYKETGRFDNIVETKIRNSDISEVQKKLIVLKESGDIAEFFKEAVRGCMNILLVGGTGSGKTTIMKSLVDCYPSNKRIFTIEDVPELDLENHPNHLNLFFKSGGLTPKKIIESCMRMKPDHVLLAELRGDEAWSYIEMLNTGHQGSITTIHANDCVGAIVRLARLVKQSEIGNNLSMDYILNTVNTSIDVIAFFDRTFLTELYYDPVSKNRLISNNFV